MKTITVSFRASDFAKFENVRKGIKKFETRACSPKYQKIESGDWLVIKCGSNKLRKKILKVYHFKSPRQLLKQLPLRHVMPDVNSAAEAQRRWNSFPGYKEKIKKFGIVAMKLS